MISPKWKHQLFQRLVDVEQELAFTACEDNWFVKKKAFETIDDCLEVQAFNEGHQMFLWAMGKFMKVIFA